MVEAVFCLDAWMRWDGMGRWEVGERSCRVNHVEFGNRIASIVAVSQSRRISLRQPWKRLQEIPRLPCQKIVWGFPSPR
jgi:hypothetical protein